MKAELVVIGNEIIRGLTVDANSAYLGRELESLGVAVMRTTAVGDDRRAIAGAVRGALRRADLVLCTGGLGPTCDDVTRAAVAGFFRSRLSPDRSVLRSIEARFARRGVPMPAVNSCQALVPDKASVLRNPQGTAPGLLFANGRKRVALLPGVPREMRAIWQTSLRRIVAAMPGRATVVHATLRAFGLPESAIAERLERVEAGLAPGELAYLPGTHGVDLRLTLSGTDRRKLRTRLSGIERDIRTALGLAIYGRDGDTMAAVAGSLLTRRTLTVALAESCTGGLVGDRLTDVPGSSAYFAGSVVAYANSVKSRSLGVSPATLRRHGAVSVETAREMARGVRRQLPAAIGVAVTGIAGPGGGTKDKPVGLVCFAVAGPYGTASDTRRFLGTRRVIKELAASTALDLLRRYLLEF
ncbi:MAG: competence/damage-inducible protein A [Candidatus Edwardsbacteria bacterium]|jgi:nicotinamide-nucleotide amidase|nr:competence/damage-inducible protein A [Candidatus Edwardsbacteria bacterium]